MNTKNTVQYLAMLLLMTGMSTLYSQGSMQVGDSLVLYLDTEYSGSLQWQQSTDGSAWIDIAQANSNPYYLEISTLTAFYRARVTAEDCDVFYSEVYEPEASEGFTVMSNGEDYLLATYQKVDGTRIDYYGPRDEQGLPLWVDQLTINAPGDTTWYQLDEFSRPTSILAQNGVQMDFNWVDGQVAVVTVLSADGLEQLSTEIDFVQGGTKASFASGVTNTPSEQGKRLANKGPRGGRALEFSYLDHGISSHDIDVNEALKAASATEGNCRIQILGCSGSSNQTVRVTANSQSGKLLGVFPAYRLEDGTYSASLPTDLAPKLNPSETCSTVASVLGTACMVTEVPGLPVYLCSALSLAMYSTAITAPFAAAVGTACASAAAGMELYCGTLNASPAPGVESLADKICKSKYLDRSFPEDILIQAYVLALPSNVYSQKQTVSGSDPFPDLYISMNSETTIRSLTLNPASPAQDQDYIAVCEISCLQAGSQVTLSVTGSDNYYDSAVYPISTDQEDGEFSILVPGADTGVRDVVTVSVSLPTGSSISRSASLVFN